MSNHHLRNNLITTKGEVDESLNTGNAFGDCSRFELQILIAFETLQSLGKIVQLVNVDFAALQLP